MFHCIEFVSSARLTRIVRQVYTTFGIELCIMTTNLNQMMVEYCHPKTTPDMPVRLAVRMSASIPGWILI